MFEVMAEVGFKRQPSVHAARQAREVMIGAPVTSLHNKLNGLEPATTAGLARFAATESAALFGFAVAVVAFNVLAVAKAALHRARGIELIEQALSSHYPVSYTHLDVYKRQPQWLPIFFQ